jgi:hypothetical protein
LGNTNPEWIGGVRIPLFNFESEGYSIPSGFLAPKLALSVSDSLRLPSQPYYLVLPGIFIYIYLKCYYVFRKLCRFCKFGFVKVTAFYDHCEHIT